MGMGMGMGGMGMGMGMGMGGPRMGGMGFNNGVAPVRPVAPMAPIAAIKKSLTLQVLFGYKNFKYRYGTVMFLLSDESHNIGQ
jgi:hypothetical protein